MGSPELPEDSDSNSLRPQPGTVIPTYMQSTTSDESDNENRDDAYSGYQPLTLTGNTGAFYEAMDLSDDEENEENNEIEEVVMDGAEGFTENDQQILEEKTISLEAEIHSEIWNAPRPNELNIELDSSKTEQIMSVMAGIKLPTTAIPEWAQGIPEEKWKEDLLEKIRKKTI